MQGLQWPKQPARTENQPKERAQRPPTIPRGSSTSMPPVPAPSVPSAIVSQPSVGVYKPPPINSFSDRVTQCQHSFPLNAAWGITLPTVTFTCATASTDCKAMQFSTVFATF
jgi:hypothetical protein